MISGCWISNMYPLSYHASRLHNTEPLKNFLSDLWNQKNKIIYKWVGGRGGKIYLPVTTPHTVKSHYAAKLLTVFPSGLQIFLKLLQTLHQSQELTSGMYCCVIQ